MAMFIYKTGVYPISLETASARITLNQDGSIQLSMGATEIGQGSRYRIHPDGGRDYWNQRRQGIYQFHTGYGCNSL